MAIFFNIDPYCKIITCETGREGFDKCKTTSSFEQRGPWSIASTSDPNVYEWTADTTSLDDSVGDDDCIICTNNANDPASFFFAYRIIAEDCSSSVT